MNGKLRLLGSFAHRSIPPTISAHQAPGFGLDLIRAVLSGRGDQVIDLARTNLFAKTICCLPSKCGYKGLSAHDFLPRVNARMRRHKDRIE
jgi:hypothetical protein